MAWLLIVAFLTGCTKSVDVGPREPVRSFIGTWSVKGSQFVIESNERGVEDNNAGPCGPENSSGSTTLFCTEHIEYALSLSPDKRVLTAVVKSVDIYESDTTTVVSGETSTRAGDRFTLRFDGPGVLKRDPWPDGNPYLCSDTTPPDRESDCGG